MRYQEMGYVKEKLSSKKEKDTNRNIEKMRWKKAYKGFYEVEDIPIYENRNDIG